MLVGAGSGPATILALGARIDSVDGEDWGGYPLSEVAAKHNASTEEETNKAEVAYARFEKLGARRVPRGLAALVGHSVSTVRFQARHSPDGDPDCRKRRCLQRSERCPSTAAVILIAVLDLAVIAALVAILYVPFTLDRTHPAASVHALDAQTPLDLAA